MAGIPSFFKTPAGALLIAAVSVVLIIVLARLVNPGTVNSSTPEQIYDGLQGIVEGARARKVQQALCALRPICKDFARARQECAAAGNYGTCIQIKMGSDRFWIAEASCTEAGEVAGLPPDKQPTVLGCLFHW